MTRQAFMARLMEGLRGLPPTVQADIVADYNNHFNEGVAAGRSEADVAAGLGDPGRLARELRAEAGLRRWEEHRSPAAGASAIFAVLGLGAIDILILLPIPIRMGNRIRMSMAPSPSTAKIAEAPDEALRSTSQRFRPISARNSRASRPGSPRPAATSASLRPAARPSLKWLL